MKPEIYYFSGTGNTLFLARTIAQKINAHLIPINTLLDKKRIELSPDVVGIIYPVYYMDLPVIVKQFAQKLDNLEDKYIFAVANYGGGIGISIVTLKELLKSRGGTLSAWFGLHMPQNAFYKAFENKKKVLENSRNKLEKVCKRVSQKKHGWRLSDYILYLLLLPISKLFSPLFETQLADSLDASPDLSMEELIYRADYTFQTNEKCMGCGICAKVCPVDNIQMKHNVPVWLHHCENCLACYNWCPNKAIENEIAQKGYYYHHPEIKVSDMIL
jgi:ferredoxin